MARRQLRTVVLSLVLLGVVSALFLLPRAMTVWRDRGNEKVRVVGTDFPVTVDDTFGRKVTIARKPQRIISLAPGVTEILFAIGAGDRVIADTSYCDYPPAAAKLPKIGGYLDPSVEKIVALSPDLVIGERGNQREVLDHLHELGILLIAIDPTTLREVANAMRLLGRVTGEVANADAAAQAFSVHWDTVQQRTSSLPKADRPRVLFLFSTEGDVYTAGPGSFIDELITLGGGVNIAGTSDKPWPQLTLEAVVKADPQVILLMGGGGMQVEKSAKSALAKLRKNQQWRNVSAVKGGKVAMLTDDHCTLPGPRLVNGLDEVLAELHPDLVSEKDDR